MIGDQLNERNKIKKWSGITFEKLGNILFIGPKNDTMGLDKAIIYLIHKQSFFFVQ